MKAEPSLIFVTSEDDRYLVKGGIGTAVGVLTETLGGLYPDRSVDWITESPASEYFLERRGSVTRHYLPRTSEEGRMSLSKFSVHQHHFRDQRTSVVSGIHALIASDRYQFIAGIVLLFAILTKFAYQPLIDHTRNT